jgi:hypothetical protein
MTSLGLELATLRIVDSFENMGPSTSPNTMCVLGLLQEYCFPLVREYFGQTE